MSAIVVLAGLAGCGGRETRAEAGIREGILHVGNGTEPASLDPQTVTGMPEAQILRSLKEGLVTLDPVTLEFRPGMAENWEISEDGKQYIFHLRPGMSWSNGDPLNAHDFVFTFQRLFSPGMVNPYINFYQAIRNAQAYQDGDISDFSEVGVRALDDYTLQVELEYPWPELMLMFRHHTSLPVHRATVAAAGDPFMRGSNWFRNPGFATNGPYLLAEWRTNQIVRVLPNPLYWNASRTRTTEIRFYPIENPETEYRAFRSGQLHSTTSVPQASIPRLVAREDPEFRNEPFLGTYYFLLNVRRPPLDDVRVRRALSLALNRRHIVDFVAQGGQEPAFHFVPPGSGGYSPGVLIEEDLEEARRLLAEAGYPGGRGFPRVELLFNTSENHRRIAEAMQQMWREALGIQITLTNQEWKVYLETRNQGNYQMARAGWVGTDATGGFFDLFTSASGNNDSGWSDPEFDRLTSLAGRTLEWEQRMDYFRQAEEILLRESPMIPLYFYTTHYMVDRRVEGWYNNRIDDRPWQGIGFAHGL